MNLIDSADFTLKDCLFGTVKLTRNPDLDENSYSRHCILFDSLSHFSYPNFDCGKNVVIFRVDNSSSVDTNNKKKDILILGDGVWQGLDDTTMTAKAKHLLTFQNQEEYFV